MPVRTKKKRHKYPLKNPKPRITSTCNATPRGCRLPTRVHWALHPDADVQVPGTAQQKARSALLPHARRTSPKDIPVRPRHTPLPVWGKHSDVLTGLVQIKQHQTVAAPRAAHQHVVKKHIPHVFLLAFHASGHGRGETDGVCRPHAVGLSVPHVDGIPRAVEAEHLAAGLLQREIGRRYGIVPTHSDPLAPCMKFGVESIKQKSHLAFGVGGVFRRTDKAFRTRGYLPRPTKD